MFTERSPIVTATAVVAMYIEIVLPPILDNYYKSESDATPVINDERTRGTAISLSRLINILPNGEIQFETKTPQPCVAASIPKRSPKTRPIIIFQCSSSFIKTNFILYLNWMI